MQLARRIRRLALASVALAVLMAMPDYAQGSQSADQQLAAKYAPLLSLDPQSKPCGPGEAYRPTIIGIPLAIHRFVRWSLFAQACVLDDLQAPESLHRSSELVRGQWWRTFGFTALVDILAVLSGPLFGVGLLLLTDHSLNFINLAAALVYTVTVPYAAIQLTLYYFDLESRAPAETQPA